MNNILKITVFLIILVLAIISIITISSINLPLKSFIVQSGSMRPNISEGSIVFVERNLSDFKKGDIITFKKPDNPRVNITHRIYKIIKNGKNLVYKTKGDANRAQDPWVVRKEAVLGKVILSIPFLGYIIAFSKTKLGVILVVVLPLFIIIADEIRVIQKELKKKKKRKKKIANNTPLILLFFLFLVLPRAIFAGFYDQVNLSNQQIATGYWEGIDTASPIAVLAVSDAWTKTIEEKITSNSGFENGDLTDWDYSGQVEVLAYDNIENPAITVTPYTGNYMVRIGTPDNPGNWVWENRLMRSIDTGAKSLSLFYRYFSRDLSGFDEPGFFIRLNGEEIYRHANLNSDGVYAEETGWQQFYYDLTGQNNSKINLGIYAGNTGDTMTQSWVYIDRVTTYFSAAPVTAEYSLAGEDEDSGVNNIKYKLYGDGEDEPDEWTSYISPFQIDTSGQYNLHYQVEDNADNVQDYWTQLVVDGNAPSDVSDLSIDEPGTGVNTLALTWTSPGNDGLVGKAATYDVRYQKYCNKPADFNFETAAKVEGISSPQESFNFETLNISGLDASTDYCFGLKTADEAPNWSNLSNIVTGQTLGGPSVNPGDVVINELLWMGSNASEDDEWLELRNLTDHNINLDGFYLTRLESGEESPMSVDFTGRTIDANSYFLIANGNSYGGNDSEIKVTADIWDTNLDLSNDSLRINFYTGTNELIDTAWDGTAPTEGFYDPVNHKYYSMERVSIPGDGTNPLNWYTGIDEDSTTDYFDGGSDERGTPRAPNRSENEPLANQIYLDRDASNSAELITPTVTPTPVLSQPEIVIGLSETKTTITYGANNINDFVQINIELTYDTDSGLQGVTGVKELNGENEYIVNNLILGTCSTGGTCVYHTGVKNIKLKVELADVKGEKFNLEKTLEI